MLALFLMIIGYSGLTPTQTAFGGDQFDLPQQQAEITRFFTIFYFTNNLASTMANFVTPILRKDVHCLGLSTCYALGFGEYQ